MEFQDFDVFVTDVREESADDRTIARFRVHVKDVETEGVETTLDISALLEQLDNWTSLRPTWAEVLTVGKLLGDALFPAGRIRETLLESLVKPRRRESRLRITFNMGTLSKYPWEFVVVPTEKGETTQHDILALNSQVSLIRLIDLSPVGTSNLMPATLPLQMVMALSNPKGTPKLRLDREKKAIQQGLGQSERVHVTYVDKAQPTDYLASLKHVHLFHFAGHGSFEELPTAGEVSGKGVIWLNGDDNTAKAVDAPTLALKLADADVRVAILGACLTAKHDDIHVWSSIATSLLKAGTGAVVAMQYAVEDATAIEFARAFYESLAMGFPIDQAVTKGRLAICEKGDARGVGTPVLYMRKSDGILFPNLTNDPALTAERAKTHVIVKLSAGLVEGEVTGIDVTTMTGGKAESTMNVEHVAAGGIVTGFKGGTLSGGNVNVNLTATTVGKGAKVVGAQVTSLDGSSNVKSTQTVDKVEGDITGVSLDSLGGGVAFGLPGVTSGGVGVDTTSIDQHIGEITGGSVIGVQNIVITSSQPDPTPKVKPKIEERIRVDVAHPDKAQVNEVFDLAVAIRMPESPLLTVDDLSKTVSASGKTFRSEPGEIIRYRVAVTAPNCVIHGPSEYVFLMRPAQDSEPYFFQLEAKKKGRITIMVDAYQEGGLIAAQTRVKIEAYVEAVA